MFFKIRINSENIAFWIKNHFLKILIIFSLCIILGISLIVWNRYQESRKDRIQDELYILQKSFNDLTKKKSKDSETEKLNLFKSLAQKKPLVLTAEMQVKVNDYEKGIRKNHKSIVAVGFAIELANFYYQQGDVQKAKELISLFAFPKKSSSLYHLASFQLTSYYMDDKECEKALQILQDLSQNKQASSFYLESHLQQAFCLEELGHYEKSLQKYDKVINEDTKSYVGRLAQDYKKLLILRRKIKKEK